MTTTTKAAGRFVSIPAHRIEELAALIACGVEARGGTTRWVVEGRERVFEITPPGARARVRFFSTLTTGAADVRECGADAARVVVIAVDGEKTRPLEKAKRILRTAPRKLPEDRRIEAWIARVKTALRAGYVRARAVQACPDCGAPMAQRKSSHGPFMGCSTYPRCRATVRIS